MCVLVLKTQLFRPKNPPKRGTKEFFMVFKWFNMMIKMRQNCGANYEIMQINRKILATKTQTRRNKAKRNKNVIFAPSKPSEVNHSTTHYFLCFIEFSAHVFTCLFHSRSTQQPQLFVSIENRELDTFENILVEPLEPLKKGRRDM